MCGQPAKFRGTGACSGEKRGEFPDLQFLVKLETQDSWKGLRKEEPTKQEKVGSRWTLPPLSLFRESQEGRESERASGWGRY